MPRSSSTGCPFLVSVEGRRGKRYVYFRKLPPGLAPMVAGVAPLPWRRKVHALAGKNPIKIALGTGDLATARDRWAGVHQAVNDCVAEAKRRASGHVLEPRRIVCDLSPEEAGALAAQARHDALKADDDAVVTGALPPLARGIKRALKGRVDDQTARLTAARLEERQLRRALMHGDAGLLDVEITTVRQAATPEFMAYVARCQAAGPGARIAEPPPRLKPLSGPEVLPSELTLRLAENGLDAPEGSPARRRAALALQRAKLQAAQDVHARLRGAPIETPPRPGPILPPRPSLEPQPPARTALGLDEALRLWTNRVRPAAKTLSHARLYVRRFKQIVGDKPLDEIAKADMLRFRDTISRYPRNLPETLREASPEEVLAWREAHPDAPLLTPQTVNNRAIGALSALFETAIRETGLAIVNPCQKLKLPIKAADRTPRRGFTAEELSRLFAGPIHADGARFEGGAGEAQHWIPLLALYTGARLEELGQLHVGDVKTANGCAVIDITDVDGAKRLKTEAARRRTPLHRDLAAFGFFDYVERLRAAGEERLFPEMASAGERLTKNFSRFFGRYIDDHVSREPGLVFHSFRHAFVDRQRAAETPEETIAALVGHSRTSTTANYGKAVHLHVLKAAIERMSFDDVELGHLRRRPGG